MKWSDEYATGIERLDTQHKTLFKMTEDFRGALDEGLGENVYGDLLRSLDLYARTHFGFEEGLMERHQCPSSRQNREAHERFVEILAGFQERYTQHGFDREDAHAMVNTMDRWLVNHICRLDLELKGHTE
jgi:hemerythrin